MCENSRIWAWCRKPQIILMKWTTTEVWKLRLILRSTKFPKITWKSCKNGKFNQRITSLLFGRCHVQSRTTKICKFFRLDGMQRAQQQQTLVKRSCWIILRKYHSGVGECEWGKRLHFHVFLGLRDYFGAMSLFLQSNFGVISNNKGMGTWKSSIGCQLFDVLENADANSAEKWAI